jgi:hypothetical protein
LAPTAAPDGGFIAKLNHRVEHSRVGKYFDITGRGTTFSTEVRAGIVCFLT